MQLPSYSHGTTTVPLLGDTIGDNLRRTVEKFGDREALVSCHQSYRATYREFWDQTGVIGRALMARGIKKGDRVGLWSPNRFEWAVSQYATSRIGAIMVNINPAFRTHELVHALKQSGASLLVMARGFRQTDYVAMVKEAEEELPEHLKVIVIDDEWRELKADARLVSEDELQHREQGLDPDDAIDIQYTSGTTGFPKGATLSLNGNAKLFGARNYAELNLLERMWTANDKGTPVSVPPVAPVGKPVATPPAVPSPTLTPFS